MWREFAFAVTHEAGSHNRRFLAQVGGSHKLWGVRDANPCGGKSPQRTPKRPSTRLPKTMSSLSAQKPKVPSTKIPTKIQQVL